MDKIKGIIIRPSDRNFPLQCQSNTLYRSTLLRVAAVVVTRDMAKIPATNSIKGMDVIVNFNFK